MFCNTRRRRERSPLLVIVIIMVSVSIIDFLYPYRCPACAASRQAKSPPPSRQETPPPSRQVTPPPSRQETPPLSPLALAPRRSGRRVKKALVHIAPLKAKSKSRARPSVAEAEAKPPGDTWQSKHYLLEQRLKVQLRRGNKVLYLYTTLCLTDLPGKDVRYCIHAGMVVRYYFPMLLCN